MSTAQVFICRTPAEPLEGPAHGQRLGDWLAETFDSLPVDPNAPRFTRQDQGEGDCCSDLFGSGNSGESRA